MKKIIFAAIALCTVLSCAKEGFETNDEAKPIVFTAELPGSKTTVSADGKVGWVKGEEITITKGSDKGIYTVNNYDEHRFATLSYKSGTNFTEGGVYTATYGDENDQWYDGSCPGSNCPMSATATAVDGFAQLTFHNTCGVVAVTANTGSNKIAQIKIGNKTLNFATPQALDGTYLVAVTPGEAFTEVAFVKDDGSKASKTISSASVEINEIRDLKTGDYFSKATYDGFEPLTLPGVFSVGPTKTVHFSKGLVYTEGGTLKYSTNQLEIFGAPTTTKTAYYKKADVPARPEGWEILTLAEWEYLLQTRDVDSEIIGITNPGSPSEASKVYENVRFAKGVIAVDGSNKVNGVLIFPDYFRFPQDIADKISKWERNYPGTSARRFYTYLGNVTGGNNWGDKYEFSLEDFNKLQNLGVVFLGAFGRYSGSALTNQDAVFYLDPSEEGDNNSFNVTYSNVYYNTWFGKTNQSNIRLVKPVKPE